MKFSTLTIHLLFLLCACTYAQQTDHSNPRLLGGPCEGCEAVLEFGDQQLGPVDTLPTFHESGLKLKLTGTIYEPDGKTPASGIILYVYHTNQEGIYPTKGDEKGWAKRHGYIRGWIKTGADGRYTFYTIKPASYPSGTLPAHIHPIILEPDGRYYWVGEYLFEGDPLLSKDDIAPKAPRCGSPGLLHLKKEGELWVATRDFVLGQNVPEYE